MLNGPISFLNWELVQTCRNVLKSNYKETTCQKRNLTAKTKPKIRLCSLYGIAENVIFYRIKHNHRGHFKSRFCDVLRAITRSPARKSLCVDHQTQVFWPGEPEYPRKKMLTPRWHQYLPKGLAPDSAFRLLLMFPLPAALPVICNV